MSSDPLRTLKGTRGLEVVSIGSLPAASHLWLRSGALWMQTIVCKATFELLPGKVKLAQVQEPINEDDNHWDDDSSRGLHAPSDLAPQKARADVVLVGHAFAPGGRPVRSLVARLAVGTVDKSIEIHGDRTWTANGSLSEPASFTSMPLRYERAAGGPGTANPVGVSASAPSDVQGAVRRAPNLQAHGALIHGETMSIAPIGFGPIAASWPARQEMLGRGSRSPRAAGFDRRMPLEGVEAGYFNCAPSDQQIESLSDDASLLLENLDPTHARLETALPGLRPRARLEIAGALPQEVRMRCDTLWIDTDRSICTVTWRGQIPLQRPDDAGRVVIDVEAPGSELASREAAARDRMDPSANDAERTQPVRGEWRDALPFPAPMGTGLRNQEGAEPPIDGSDNVLPFKRPPLGATCDPAMTPIAPAIVLSPWAAGASVAGPDARGREAARTLFAPTADARESVPEKELARGGALAASNAAAGANAKVEEGTAEAARKPEPKPARERPREVIELLWYDPAALPRIRRNLAWKKIISELKPRPSDDDFDGGLPPEQMKAAKDKRDVLGVLARGEVMNIDGIRRAMEMAVLEDGSFVPPYVLTAGVVELAFDEMKTLEANLVAVAPFVPLDKKLKDVVEYVNEVLKTPGIERGRKVVEGLAAKLRAAFEQGNRGLPAGYLQGLVEEMLVEEKCYRKQTMNGSWITSKFTCPEPDAIPLPTFLPDKLENDVPCARFAARMMAEASVQPIQGNARHLTLRAIAIASSQTSH